MTQIRNIAIIAHVDHGKTTLIDQLLQQSNIFRHNQVVQEQFLDSNDLERERGITILSKNISIPYENTKINLIDTPGHSDFGGEVERVLKMADGVLLLVDSFEGPMPQTRFVLEKALHLRLKPIVVINKIDRPDNRPEEVLDEVYDLFIDLDADESQLDFPVIYASGRSGWGVKDLKDERKDLIPLLDSIIENIPQPVLAEGTTQMQVTTLDYSDYVGRIGIGRVFRGVLSKGKPLSIIKRNGQIHPVNIKQLFVFEGLERKEVEEVLAGDICALVGIEDIDIGDTIADAENPEPMPIIAIDEPTISMNFTVNTSPFYGREGKYVTSRHLHDRLQKELKQNVALIYKEIDGKKAEPIEILAIDVPTESSGKVIELVGQKKGELVKMEQKGSLSKLEFHIPSRGLMGLRNKVLTATQGEGIMHHRFYQYEFFKGSVAQRQSGVLISMHEGQSTAYAINSLQDRGKFFIEPGDVVYRGQIIGEYNKDNDIEVHVQRGKKLTNMRASGADKAAKIAPSIKFTLEECLEYIKDDELVEVTPESIRMRKLYLDPNERKRFNQKKV